MSTQSVNISACTFPKLLEKEVEKVERTLSFEIEFSSLEALGNVFEKDLTHFNQILRVCWALVLRCYTGIDTVSFAYEEEISPGESGFSALVMDIQASETLADMLNGGKTAMATDLRDIWKEVNSAMLIRKVMGAGEPQKLTRTVVSPEVGLQTLISSYKADLLNLVPPPSPCAASERELPDLLGSLDWSDILQERKEYCIYLRRGTEPNPATSWPSNRRYMLSQHT